MAPSAVTSRIPVDEASIFQTLKINPKVARQIESEGGTTNAKYPHYLPTWNHGEKYPPLEPFEYIERAKDADPSLKDVLPLGSAIKHLTPKIGSEVSGVQLSQLIDAGKNQLALLVVQRKVVAFRDQDFVDLPIQDALGYGSHFGRHHVPPTTGSPEGYPEVQIIHRSPTHSDVSFEDQTPGMIFIYALNLPDVGGDTVVADGVEAYKRYPPTLQRRLHGLKAVHSNMESSKAVRAKGLAVRREGTEAEHSIVRTHPATGEKSLFVTESFMSSIIGLEKEESDFLISFLRNLTEDSQDLHTRVFWETETVVAWDNRTTTHTVIFDFNRDDPIERRHLGRITLKAERPYETPFVEPSTS